jgi:hypothetical protein
MKTHNSTKTTCRSEAGDVESFISVSAHVDVLFEFEMHNILIELFICVFPISPSKDKSWFDRSWIELVAIPESP